MIVIFDHGLCARKSKTLHQRVEKTKAAFQQLDQKLNRYNLKTQDKIAKACDRILAKHQTGDFFQYSIHNDPLITEKNKNPGRPKKGEKPETVTVSQDRFSVELSFDHLAFEQALQRAGYYPLITNKPSGELSLEEAMMAHKNQYKCEHLNRRAKSSYNLEPIYLHTPERIEALLFLFKIALQIVVLIERTARDNIHKRDRGLDNFMPNRKDVRNPRTEYLLQAFQYVVSGQILLDNGVSSGFVSELTETQKDILAILEVPVHCFTYPYLFDTS
jgi:transposase